MGNTNTYHAMVAKTKAMYGRRITSEQYKDLLRCRTVPEVAVYLKQNTVYSGVLENISESSIHRGQLEALVNRAAFERYSRLYRFLPESRDNLFDFLLIEREISEILRMVLLIKAGNAKSFIIDLPGYLIEHSDVDLLTVAKAGTFSELISALKGSDYAGILGRFAPDPKGGVTGAAIDYIGCEYAVYHDYYKKLFGMINNSYRGQERKELNDLFKVQVELLNIEHLFRSQYLETPREEVVRSIFPYHYRLKPDKIHEMMEVKDTAGLKQQMMSTRYSRMFDEQPGAAAIEGCTMPYFYNFCKRALRFSNFASVVFFAYYNLHQVEVKNLITIIEGIRYDLPEKQITELLVGVTI